jgi:ATP-dependent DNA ligase
VAFSRRELDDDELAEAMTEIDHGSDRIAAIARLVDEAPKGNDWSHEIKYEGYRMQARIDGSQIKLLTRTDLDCSSISENDRGTRLPEG